MTRLALLLLVVAFVHMNACPPYGSPCVGHFSNPMSTYQCSALCGAHGYHYYCHNPNGMMMCYCFEPAGYCGCASASANGLPLSCGYNAATLDANNTIIADSEASTMPVEPKGNAISVIMPASALGAIIGSGVVLLALRQRSAAAPPSLLG